MARLHTAPSPSKRPQLLAQRSCPTPQQGGDETPTWKEKRRIISDSRCPNRTHFTMSKSDLEILQVL